MFNGLSALSVSYSESDMCGGFVWVRRVLNIPKRRLSARAVDLPEVLPDPADRLGALSDQELVRPAPGGEATRAESCTTLYIPFYYFLLKKIINYTGVRKKAESDFTADGQA